MLKFDRATYLSLFFSVFYLKCWVIVYENQMSVFRISLVSEFMNIVSVLQPY